MSLPAADWSTSEVVTAAKMNAQIRDNWDAAFPTDSFASASWTPTLQGSTSGASSGTTTGRQMRIGPLQFIWARFTGIASAEISGAFTVTLPVAASGITADNVGQVLGTWQAYDNNAPGASEHGAVLLVTSTTVQFHRISSKVTETAPFTWATADFLMFQAVYPVA